MHEKYSPELAILAFPSNQFSQEPRNNKEIKEFAREKGAKFQMFAKVDINGKTTTPLYQYLKRVSGGTFTNDIKWNYTKFLVSRSGRSFKRYSPHVNPLDITNDIEHLLSIPPQPVR